MAILKSDLLFWADLSAFGPNARKAHGYPNFARNGSAWEVDDNGIYNLYARNVILPSFAKDINGKTVSALRTMPARSTLIHYQQPSISWSGANLSLTASIDDPANTLTAVKMNAVAGGGFLTRTLDNAPVTGTNALCFVARKGTGSAATWFGWWDTTAAVWRARVEVTWGATVDATPTVVLGVGGGVITAIKARANGYWYISATVTSVVSGNSNAVYVYPAGSAGTGTVDVWFIQPEGVNYSTEFIGFNSGSQITRQSDLIYWDNMFLLQNFVFYMKWYHTGDSDANDVWRWWMGDLAGAAPCIRLGDFNAGAIATLRYFNGSDKIVSTSALSPVIGDTMEVCGSITNGGLDLRVIASKNQGAVVTGVTTGGGVAFPAALSDRKLTLQAAGATRSYGQSDRLWFAKPGNMINNPHTGTAANVMSELRNTLVDGRGEMV